MSLREFADVAEQAARVAGQLALEMQPQVAISEKAPKDLVTAADVAAQQAIERILHDAFPDHLFLGEESSESLARSRQASSQYRWLVDPIDGTVNYAHGLPSFAVSIALEHQGRILVGVVLDPVLNDCYVALAGGGATLNGQPIRPSSCRALNSALVAASFSASVTRGSPEIVRFLEVLHEAQSMRRLGSAALNMCYVASGRLDGYYATSVKAWDVAAGALMIHETGAALCNIRGEPFDLLDPTLIAAATNELLDELLLVLRRAEPQ